MRLFKSLKEWSSEHPLQRKVLITDQFRTGNALISKLILEESPYCSNLLCVTLRQIASELVRYDWAEKGDEKEPVCIDHQMSVRIIRSFLKREHFLYFKQEWADDKTCGEIFRMMEYLRRRQTTDAFTASQEPKLLDLKRLLLLYEEKLKASNLYDSTRLLKDGTRILKENNHALTVLGYGNTLFSVLADCRMDELEKTFYHLLRSSVRADEVIIKGYTGKTVFEKLTLPQDYYSREAEAYLMENEDTQLDFYRAYGISNEVDYAARQIQESREAFGNIAVFYPSDIYRDYLAGIFQARNIPYQFIDGELLRHSRTAELFFSLADWARHNFEEKYLKPVFYNPDLKVREGLSARKQFKYLVENEGIGWGEDRYRVFFEKHRDVGTTGDQAAADESSSDQTHYSRRFLDALECMVDLFAPSIPGVEIALADFLEGLQKFASLYVQKGQVRNTLLLHWKQEERFARDTQIMIGKKELADYLSEYLNDQMTAPLEPDESRVVFYPISKREVPIRSKIYVMGLSVKYFTEPDTESAVLSDEELVQYLVQPPKDRALKEQHKRYELAASLSSIRNGRITFSYPCFDTVAMYPDSPSIFFLEAAAYAKREIGSLTLAGYDNCGQRLPVQPGEELRICTVPASSYEPVTMESLCQKTYSVTSMQELLSCPKKYYFHHILRIREPEYHDYQPGRWLQANEKGTLVHAVLERYVKSVMIEQSLNTYQEDILLQILDECVKETRQHVPIPEEATFLDEVTDIKTALIKYVAQLHTKLNPGDDSCWHALKTEYTFAPVQDVQEMSDTINFRGIIDRVDTRIYNGKRQYRIVDYKTRKYPDAEKQFSYIIQAIVYDEALRDLINAGELEQGDIMEPGFDFLFDEVPEKLEKRIQISPEKREEVEELISKTFLWIAERQCYPAHPYPDSQCEETSGPQKEAAECKYCDYKAFCKDKR